MTRNDLKIARPDLAGPGVTNRLDKPLDLARIKRDAAAAERARIGAALRRHAERPSDFDDSDDTKEDRYWLGFFDAADMAVALAESGPAPEAPVAGICPGCGKVLALGETHVCPPASGTVSGLTNVDPRDDGELCARCGRRYLTVYRMPDDVWARLIPEKAPGGLLCPACCDRAAAEQGIPLYWEAAVSRFPTDEARVLGRELRKRLEALVYASEALARKEYKHDGCTFESVALAEQEDAAKVALAKARANRWLEEA